MHRRWLDWQNRENDRERRVIDVSPCEMIGTRDVIELVTEIIVEAERVRDDVEKKRQEREKKEGSILLECRGKGTHRALLRRSGLVVRQHEPNVEYPMNKRK